MGNSITNKLVGLIGCCGILLSACDTNTENTVTSSVGTTSTPSMLRAIPMNELTAVVTLDGNDTRYYGRDYPDNNWIIYLNIETKTEYPIGIQWFADNDVLLMSQEGTVIAFNTTITATPNLISITEGAGFDYDCDGVSNLEEVTLGTDPGQEGDTVCLFESDPVDVVAPSAVITPTTLDSAQLPVLRQHYDLFANTTLTSRVTRFSQPISIQKTNHRRRAAYRISLLDVSSSISISIDLLDDPNFGRFARFFNNNLDTDVSLLPYSAADASCFETHCSIPMDWQENHWYELIFEEDTADSTQLRASILDTETQAVTQLGSFVIPANTVWTRPTVVLFYHEQVAVSDCVAGLLPVTLHYRHGEVNNSLTLQRPVVTLPTDCISFGSGASTSTITGSPTGIIQTLTLGQR